MGRVFSIGHSNRTFEVFRDLLEGRGIRSIVDVRAIPASRRHPQFGKEALKKALEEVGVNYLWIPELGGRRRGKKESRHVAWQVDAFRAYADYMETAEFGEALGKLMVEADAAPTAFMCAEALWWQCHRRLVSDALVAKGWEVLHVGSGKGVTAHVLPEFARVEDGMVIYDRGVTLPLA
jgi:uncharacterized protein (DUF488 family)